MQLMELKIVYKELNSREKASFLCDDGHFGYKYVRRRGHLMLKYGIVAYLLNVIVYEFTLMWNVLKHWITTIIRNIYKPFIFKESCYIYYYIFYIPPGH